MLISKNEKSHLIGQKNQKMAVKGLKFSSRGFTFNERIIYVDTNEIYYYSRAPKDFSKNNFDMLLYDTPKVGIPLSLVELAYPSEDWLVSKKKRNAIKVIFTQGCQMTYRMGGDKKYIHFNKEGKPVNIYDHIATIKSLPMRKKVEWVFVFRTPLDLHAFIEIVENSTNPDSSLIGAEPKIQNKGRSDSLERRNIEHIKRLGLGPEDDEELGDTSRRKLLADVMKSQPMMQELKETEEDERAKKVQIIKKKVFEQKL